MAGGALQHFLLVLFWVVVVVVVAILGLLNGTIELRRVSQSV
jgi:hypothetical protein